jgi:hypothetical protein
MEQKYVIFGEIYPGEPSQYKSFVIFPKWIEHSTIKADWEPISAGFCTISQDKDFQTVISCFGESVSLKLKSNPEKDARYITKAFRDY